MEDQKALTAAFERTVHHYLENDGMVRIEGQPHRKVNPELEIRFGTNHRQALPISSVDFQQIVKYLSWHGWTTSNLQGDQILRIIPNTIIHENEHQKDRNENGRVKMRSSNIRAEIYGVDLIQKYCQHNDLEKLKSHYSNELKFTKKTIAGDGSNKFPRLNFPDHNFSVSYMEEEEYRINSTFLPIKKIMADWKTSLKTFRSINRVRFQHSEYPVFVDLSIVKTNRKHVNRKTNQKYAIPTETIQEAGVFQMTASYEVELELDNVLSAVYATKSRFPEYMSKLRHCIRVILSALQGTPYPISYSEQEKVMHSYMCRLYSNAWMEKKTPRPFFLGPNSIPLQLENIIVGEEVSSVSNIQTNYSITEKADGERALLYVANNGRVYMISNSMRVIFTGSVTTNKKCFDSLIDGEFIMYGKHGKMLFLYAAFDIYYFGGLEKNANVRSLPFSTNNDTELDDKYRLSLLKTFHQMLDLQPVTPNASCVFHMRVKHFESCPSIFESAALVWEKRAHFDYEIDGLILTPTTFGVGGNRMGEANEIDGRKFTWRHSFKWKPPHYNTIDFLVTTVKDKDGKDLVRNIIQSQDSTMKAIVQYKTLTLLCGFDNRKQNFMNPFDDVLHDNIPKPYSAEKDYNNYEAKPFIPTVPYHPESYVCHVPLTTTDSLLQMKTLEGDYFEDDMIVEFQYAKNDTTKDGPWKWIPLRVRQDKTQQLREGKKSMNSYETANSNWKSIHFPVTEEIITGKTKVPVGEVTDTIYYSLIERNSPHTKALRDFHNLYVKSKLIEGIANYLRTRHNITAPMLIDYAVGKAGDLSKWSRSKIAFVLGIDNHGDNITNPDDGACVRYLKTRMNQKDSNLKVLFVEGTSALNIRTEGTACKTTLEKELVQSVFGQGKNLNHKKYAFSHGIAQEGFHISSCQFALHYFFESKKTLHAFLRNLSECTRLNGYFIGTCFDGATIFKMLYKRENGAVINENESIRIDKGGKKVFEIVKKYSSSIVTFEADESSVGMPIYVYQESIDKMFIEYLVHFEYFRRLMEDYGFVMLEREELRAIGFSDSSGLFNRLFAMMNKDINDNPDLFIRNAKHMSSDEKYISFMNRYFIFKKVRDLSQTALKNMQIFTAADDINANIDANDDVIPPKKIRKIKREKMILNDDNFSPVQEELVFKDLASKQFYAGLNEKTKQKLAMFSVKDQTEMVEEFMKKKKK